MTNLLCLDYRALAINSALLRKGRCLTRCRPRPRRLLRFRTDLEQNNSDIRAITAGLDLTSELRRCDTAELCCKELHDLSPDACFIFRAHRTTASVWKAGSKFNSTNGHTVKMLVVSRSTIPRFLMRYSTRPQDRHTYVHGRARLYLGMGLGPRTGCSLQVHYLRAPCQPNPITRLRTMPNGGGLVRVVTARTW